MTQASGLSKNGTRGLGWTGGLKADSQPVNGDRVHTTNNSTEGMIVSRTNRDHVTTVQYATNNSSSTIV